MKHLPRVFNEVLSVILDHCRQVCVYVSHFNFHFNSSQYRFTFVPSPGVINLNSGVAFDLRIALYPAWTIDFPHPSFNINVGVYHTCARSLLTFFLNFQGIEARMLTALYDTVSLLYPVTTSG